MIGFHPLAARPTPSSQSHHVTLYLDVKNCFPHPVSLQRGAHLGCCTLGYWTVLLTSVVGASCPLCYSGAPR